MDFSTFIENDRQSLMDDLKELISIRSVNGAAQEGMPFGPGPAAALDCYLKMGERMGFTSENFQNYAGHIDYDPTMDENGNSHADESIGIVGHVDVVDAGDGWVCNPFNPEIIDGKLYGRGIVDDKGPMVVCLHALKIIKDAGVPLTKKVRLIAGCDEEKENRCMKYYFSEAGVEAPTMSFTPDAAFPIKNGEMGVSHYNFVTDLAEEVFIEGGMAVNAVPEDAWMLVPAENNMKDLISQATAAADELEKTTGCSFTIAEETAGDQSFVKIQAKGIPSHALALQNGKNAISAMMAVAAKMDINGELGRIVKFYEEKIGLTIHAEKLADISDEVSGPITFNVGRIYSTDGKLVLEIDNRVPVSFKCRETQDMIEAAIAGTGFRMEDRRAKEAIYMEEDAFLVQTLKKAYQEVSGDYETESVIDGTCTYARCVENCVSYGPILPGQENRMHSSNEYADVDKIMEWLRIYVESIYQLAK